MPKTTIRDRAAGAIMGAFIGDALGLGPHWYYDLAELRRDYGEWITGYADPKPDRYHAGLKAGQLSQAGFILALTLRSLVECGRVQQGLPWGQTGGHADDTEAIERALALAVRYARYPGQLAAAVARNTVLTQIDDTVVSMTVAFGAVLSLLVQGNALDAELSNKLMGLVKTGELPFHTVTRANFQPPRPGDPDPPRAGRFASPDALLTPSYMARAAMDPDIRIEPAWKVSIVYGMPCAIYHQLPAAYYLAARFRDDFESAVLHAVNGGGQNQARAILTGALVGAQTGLSGIPKRFLDGLEDSTTLRNLAVHLASQVK
jgi:ADP-ribosylglycohydrolase